jgi:hypothetical protein
MFILNSRMHCVCKQKQIYFFPFGARITDVFGSLSALPSTDAANRRAVVMHGDCIWW